MKWSHIKTKKQDYIKLGNNRGLNPPFSTEPILHKSQETLRNRDESQKLIFRQAVKQNLIKSTSTESTERA